MTDRDKWGIALRVVSVYFFISAISNLAKVVILALKGGKADA